MIGTSVDVDAMAIALADAVAGTLRHRLGEELAVASAQPNIDERELSELLSGAYREWKLNRIDAAASDAVLNSFAQGSLVATRPDVVVSWVVDAAHNPCADCDDNALDGPQVVGSIFATGDRAPIAHAGCRCLLVCEDLLQS